ncbi:hypothetical protein [Halorussus aquaticus]|uniref:DUF7847 domain-containing protein n=1 Tax=Halorussus aquaticus TaxID=2953748 RepID=A0ABD5PXB8_9EURY|nr:hypothetical protein [Halorussus aquaticus]
MAVVSSLSTAVETLRRNPVLFVAGAVVALLNAAVAGGQMLSSGPARVAWSFGTFAVQLASLVFVAGAYGMVAEAFDGTPRLGTILSEGKANFADVLAATLLLVVAAVAVFVVAMVVGVIGLVVVISSEGGDLSPVILALGLGATYLLALLPMFFLQFYLPAVVVSDESPADSLKRSYRLVRRNLLSTLGFDAVLAVVTVVGSLPVILLYARHAGSLATGTATQTTYPLAGLSPEVVVPYLAATAVLGTVTGTFFYVYQVAFYRECLSETDDEVADTSAVGA